MATKRRRPKTPNTPLIIMMGVKVDGKRRTLALSRQGKLIKGVVFDDRATNPAVAVKSGVKLDFGNGEALHTALHALGVWTWGASDGDP